MPTAHFDVARLTFDVAGQHQTKEVQEFATTFMARHFTLTPNKVDAQYLIQMRTESYTDYATRNRSRVPSNTLIVISICRLSAIDPEVPLDASKDCQNLNFSFFAKGTILDKMRYAQDAWWSHISKK
jgi:hypothetical protein